MTELQDTDSTCRRLQRFARFERQRETRLADRQNREAVWTRREEELVEETRKVQAKIDRIVSEIGDLVFELDLVGVNLW